LFFLTTVHKLAKEKHGPLPEFFFFFLLFFPDFVKYMDWPSSIHKRNEPNLARVQTVK